MDRKEYIYNQIYKQNALEGGIAINTIKTFCETCRNDVDYTVSSVKLSGKIKDKEYYYLGKEACCADCGAPVFVPEINDYNLKSLYDVFRRERRDSGRPQDRADGQTK